MSCQVGGALPWRETQGPEDSLVRWSFGVLDPIVLVSLGLGLAVLVFVLDLQEVALRSLSLRRVDGFVVLASLIQELVELGPVLSHRLLLGALGATKNAGGLEELGNTRASREGLRKIFSEDWRQQIRNEFLGRAGSGSVFRVDAVDERVVKDEFLPSVALATIVAALFLEELTQHRLAGSIHCKKHGHGLARIEGLH